MIKVISITGKANSKDAPDDGGASLTGFICKHTFLHIYIYIYIYIHTYIHR